VDCALFMSHREYYSYRGNSKMSDDRQYSAIHYHRHDEQPKSKCHIQRK
jgi:hypothetical protein